MAKELPMRLAFEVGVLGSIGNGEAWGISPLLPGYATWSMRSWEASTTRRKKEETMIPPKAPKTCERCGVTYIPTGTRQKYCEDCGAIIKKELKRAYVRTHPKKQVYKKPTPDRIVKKPTLTLAQAVKEARERGMTYGQYISWRCS